MRERTHTPYGWTSESERDGRERAKSLIVFHFHWVLMVGFNPISSALSAHSIYLAGTQAFIYIVDQPPQQTHGVRRDKCDERAFADDSRLIISQPLGFRRHLCDTNAQISTVSVLWITWAGGGAVGIG